MWLCHPPAQQPRPEVIDADQLIGGLLELNARGPFSLPLDGCRQALARPDAQQSEPARNRQANPKIQPSAPGAYICDNAREAITAVQQGCGSFG